jgi:hypothetical protein
MVVIDDERYCSDQDGTLEDLSWKAPYFRRGADSNDRIAYNVMRYSTYASTVTGSMSMSETVRSANRRDRLSRNALDCCPLRPTARTLRYRRALKS